MAIDYQAKKDALEEALLAGELTVESDGDRVTYRSVAEMRSAIAYCDDRIAAVQSVKPSVKTTFASYDAR